MRSQFPLLFLAPLAFGQHTLNCDDNYSNNERDRMSCEIRDLKAAPTGALRVNAGNNGSVRVTGWDRNEVSIRAKVQAWAESDAEARAIASKV